MAEAPGRAEAGNNPQPKKRDWWPLLALVLGRLGWSQADLDAALAGTVAPVAAPGAPGIPSGTPSGTPAVPAPLAPFPTTPVVTPLRGQVQALADALYRGNVRTFEAALRQQVEDALKQQTAAAGLDAGAVKLTNPEVLDAIRVRAEWSAQSIARTYARDLARMLARVPEGTSPAELARLVAQWDAARAPAKAQQIARTEASWARSEATRQFVARSGITGQAWFGGSEQCPVCADAAAGSPYQLDDPDVPWAPLHPNCLDETTVQYSEMGAIWRGD